MKVPHLSSDLDHNWQCTETVIDRSGVLAGNEASVEAAAKPLQELGAEVYVRTSTNMQGQPNLDHYVQTLVAQCTSWQNANGGRKGNLLLFVHTKEERAAGIYSGLQFKQPVDDNYVRILADHMKPHFRQNDHSGAMVAGMQETHRVIYQHLHPGSQTSTTVVNFAGLAWAAGMLGASIVLAVLVFYLVKWVKLGRRNKQLLNKVAPKPLSSNELRQQLDQRVPAGSSKEEFVTIFNDMTAQQDKAQELRQKAEELIE